MKATVGHPQSVDAGQVPFASSLVLSILLHSALVLWIVVGAWLLSRTPSYRLSSHTVFLGGDSPFAIDQIPGEGGGVVATKQVTTEPGEPVKAAQREAGAEALVDKFTPPVEKPLLPPPRPVVEKAAPAPTPKPSMAQVVPPPPRPVVEKPLPPTPAPKPVVEKVVAAPPKPPPEAMTLVQKEKETKLVTPPPLSPTAIEAPPAGTKLRERQVQPEVKETRTASEVQQTIAQLRQRQAEQQRAEQAAQQRVASLRAEQAERQTAEQRIAALRARVGESGTASGSGTAGTGSGSGLPGGGRGTGTAGGGGIGTGGLSGIRLRTYQELIRQKITNAWSIPPQSKGLQAVVFLALDRTGRVAQLHFVQRSGNVLFDESLQRAIKQAEPLPPLPEDYAGQFLEAELRFRPLD